MARSVQFTVAGEPDVQVLVEEIDGDLHFTVTVDETGGMTADLRGIFWDVADASKLGGMSYVEALSADVTDSQFDEDNVDDLGNGANMHGQITKGGNDFDAGVEIGTQGIGGDDVQSTTFVIDGGGIDLTLDDLANMRIGVRLTSVGQKDGDRSGSLKLEGLIPAAPDAIDDDLCTDEDNAGGMSLLDNDSDADGDVLTVTAVSGGTVDGAPFTVQSDALGRNIEVTVDAAGNLTADPLGNFEDLGTGESDVVTLTYTITDGNGGEDCADVVITIKGVNDAPEAVDDGPFFVEEGDMTTADVLANDSDVDSPIDSTSLAFSGATEGVAVNVGGQLKYTADSLAADFVDDSVADTFIYTVDDDEGATSNQATVTVNVIDPMRETGVNDDGFSNGQAFSLTVSTEDRTFNDSSFLEIDMVSGSVDQTVNVSFVIDGSGSISTSEYQQQLLAVQNVIDQLRLDYDGSAATVNVQLVQYSGFNSSTGRAEQDSYLLDNGALDDITVGTPLSNQFRSFTYYENGLDLAVDFFEANGGAASDNFMLFTSDGEPTDPQSAWIDEVNELQSTLDVSITAVGFGAADLNVLNVIDNTGAAQVVMSAAGLGDAFADSPVFPAELVNFEVFVNGVDQGLGTGDLAPLGGGDYELDTMLLGLDNSNGATNTVQVLTQWDTDGDGSADAGRSAFTTIDGTDGSGIIF